MWLGWKSGKNGQGAEYDDGRLGVLKEAESTPAARGFVEAAVGRFNRQLHAFLRRRVRDAAEVDDLAQEVYLRLLRSADIDVVGSPLSYVYGVAAHVASEFNT